MDGVDNRAHGTRAEKCPARHIPHPAQRERVLYGQLTGPNPLNHRDDSSGPALRHWSLDSLFQRGLLQVMKLYWMPSSSY